MAMVTMTSPEKLVTVRAEPAALRWKLNQRSRMLSGGNLEHIICKGPWQHGATQPTQLGAYRRSWSMVSPSDSRR